MAKLCECGCGQEAPINRHSHAARGYTAGQPHRFCYGHNLLMLRVPEVERPCKNCQTPIRVKRYDVKHGKGGFCSQDCRWAYISKLRRVPVQKVCSGCGVEFTVSPSVAGVYCTKSCQTMHARGPASLIWKNGATRFRGHDWRDRRKSILVRDDYKCQDCGLTQEQHREKFGRRLGVHHIVAYRLWASSNEANQPDNLVTLCDSCHAEREHTDDLIAMLTAYEAAGQEEFDERVASHWNW